MILSYLPRRLLGSILLSAIVASSCGKGLNEIKKEEKEVSLSPTEQVTLGKSLLEIGRPSDAKELFSSALDSKALSPADCTESERGFKSCPYCDAIYGKAIADLVGTLQLISQLAESLAGSKEHQANPRLNKMEENKQNKTKVDKLISGTIDSLVELLLIKIDSLRKNFKEVIDQKCETQVNATAVVNLLGREIIIPGKPKEDEKIIYSPYFANFVNSLLSLISGILDIAYSQNWGISAIYIRDFTKELLSQTEQKNLLEIVAGFGDLFANNPELWTQKEGREHLWNKSATDLAEALEGAGEFLKKLPNICSISGEATQKFIVSLPLGEIICSGANLLSPTFGKLADVLAKWARSLKGESKCNVIDGKKIPISANDGCIKIFEDIVLATKGTLLENIGVTEIFALAPSEFFIPRDLRAFLPLVKEIDVGKKVYIFHFEKEENEKDDEHFKIGLHTLSKGHPKPLTNTNIPADGISGSPLYIPFGDPTFGGSLFITLYYLNDGKCNTYENEKELCEKEWYVKVDEWGAGNYALNKFMAKLLTSPLIKGLIGNILK